MEETFVVEIEDEEEDDGEEEGIVETFEVQEVELTAEIGKNFAYWLD